MTRLDHITSDPAVCAGQPVIRGTRVLVRAILGYLAHGETIGAILREFPSIQEVDVRAVIAFAAASASEDLPAPSPVPPNTKVREAEAGREPTGFRRAHRRRAGL